MRRKRTNVAGAVIVAALAAAVFFGVLAIPGATAQRQGYVEKRVISTGTATGFSAFANQLAPDPTTGMCLQADASNRTVWGPCGNLPSGGTPGQVAGVVASTATMTVLVTGSQTSIATQTYSLTSTETGTGTDIQTGTGTGAGTSTATGATGTFTYTGTSTATSVTSVGEVSTTTAPDAVAISGTTMAVVTSDAKLKIYDLSTISSPSYITEIATNAAGKGVAWKGNYVLVISSGRMEVFDLTTPSSPSYVTYLALAYTSSGGDITVVGDRAYVTFSSTASRIEIVNVSNPASPSSVSSSTVTGDTPEGLAAASGYMFVANAGTADRLESYQINNPDSLGYAGNGATGNNPNGVGILSPTYALVAQPVTHAVYLMNISTPSSPSYSASVTVGDDPTGIAVTGGRYVAVTFPSLNKVTIYDFQKYAGVLTWTGTQTTTNTQTVTSTVTLTQTVTGTTTITQTGTATGTQTVTGTSSFTASVTGIGTGTDTSWDTVDAPASSVLGNYYLVTVGGEGEAPYAIKLEDFTNGGGIDTGSVLNKATTVGCSTGSDGLIGSFLHTAGKEPWPVWAGGMWAAHVRASSTGPAAIRVEVWDNTDGHLFDMTTEAIYSPGPTDFWTSMSRPARRPSTSTNKIYFKLYATCSSAADVSFYSEQNLTSWIETPLHSDKQDSQNIDYNGSTVYAALMSLEGKLVGLRSVFVSAFDFANSESLAAGSRGSGSTYARYLIMPDGTDSAVHSYYWRVPADYTTTTWLEGQMIFRPLWVPITVDADYSHRVTWEINFANLATGGDAAASGTTFFWDGDTSFTHTGTDGFQPTSTMLESGTYYVMPNGVLRLTVERGHSHGSDTYVGDVGFIGLQIDYPSSL